MILFTLMRKDQFVMLIDNDSAQFQLVNVDHIVRVRLDDGVRINLTNGQEVNIQGENWPLLKLFLDHSMTPDTASQLIINKVIERFEKKADN